MSIAIKSGDTIYCGIRKFRRLSVPGKNVLQEVGMVGGHEELGDTYELISVGNIIQPNKNLEHLWILDNVNDIKQVEL